jgi:nucleoid-associated protein YgaU
MDLKDKYQPVADFLSRRGAQIQHFHVEGDKVVLEATVHDDAEKERVWDQIKKVDASFADLKHGISVSGSVPVPTESYTVVGGDTLGKIAKHFYGNAGDYMKIFNANTDQLSNPDMIKVGQTLKVPF